MRISFFGLARSFSAREIGGNNSIIRRIAFRLADIGDQVDYVEYGASRIENYEISSGVWYRAFRTLNESLKHLSDGCNHVISIYLKPYDRISYGRFRKTYEHRILFHHFYTGLSRSYLKRKTLFYDAHLWPFNGCLFSVSPRIDGLIGEWAARKSILFPPVPNDYFLSPEEKPKSNELRVTYAGRFDTGKGVYQAVEACRRLTEVHDVKVRISGYISHNNLMAKRLHESLLEDPNIIYESVKPEKWTPSVDRSLCALLRETDILLLPYLDLASTIDMPLLLLEGMASLCVILAPPLGDILKVYGHSPFILSDSWNTDKIVDLILRASEHIVDERLRIFGQCKKWPFDTESVTERFRKELSDAGKDTIRSQT
jgi:glycosyltransferase involved in cell wall biosynthesis